MKTLNLNVKIILKETYWLNSQITEVFKSFIACANARVIATDWFTWPSLWLPINFILTALKRFTPGSEFEMYTGKSFEGGTCMNKFSSGSGKGKRNLIAGTWD